MKQKLLLISFDFIKESYPDLTYSIATILASLKHDKELSFLETEHFGINLSILYKSFNKNTQTINENIKYQLWNKLRAKAFDYDFIAIGVTTWSNIHVEYLVNEVLKDFPGRIILGGYEITASDNRSLLKTYPQVDFFIKGYSETALKQILSPNYKGLDKIINIPLNENDLISPYLTGVVPLRSKKVHWETKRGCPHRCGFCEWGNASNKKVININEERLFSEIKLFRASNIEEINLLDGTFNIGKNYVNYLENVLYNTQAKVTLQTRFENISTNTGEQDFLKICQKFSNRVKLEFGLQTIHSLEMEVIGRKNDLSKVKETMFFLNKYGIHYEVSLIYGIPGQTYDTFAETVDFVLKNGCQNIRAFPLRIPRNSEMEKQREALRVKEKTLEFNVDQVTSSFSFDESDYVKMQTLAEKLYLGDFRSDRKSINNNPLGNNYIVFEEDNPYEWRIKNISQKNPLKLYKKEAIKKNNAFQQNPNNDDFVEFLLRKVGDKLLDIAVKKGGEYIKQKADTNPNLQSLIDLIEELYKSEFWTYEDVYNEEYFCNLKFTNNGNVLIFKGNHKSLQSQQ